MLAVIQTGGKQYIVREGQELNVELLTQEPGSDLLLDALLIFEEDGSDAKVGTPTVSGAKVETKVLEHGRAKKVSVIKYKPKVRYRRNVGHRQPFTKIKIEKISA
ncbi:TPA: 50S ribosomal protein L21 [Candidatus Uhrbacteria bacterium]|uniref:Large ribosomal subunit protein bL21 n=2 Tax=Candidatus Uhriibacteriota TaxID=1752732 RepID=A0A0G1QAG1_9BACT|nr:MAG: 50S ribosomal protein L21 [Candidatus Uhrbacteria bacterium GW2011_GWF2_46_218]KKU41782.1 MAG: 50S ribosomal protein L21 [Candidatus Uhrbacteria bacterium GW2011_GWE2_46_68]HCB18761.1 50S ribosomal protein L21 [Candidatus Uhrbacteria bacterium]